MASLVWLTIPVGALVLGLLWTAWSSRTRPRADTHETLQEHARFKAAFETPPDSSDRRGSGRPLS